MPKYTQYSNFTPLQKPTLDDLQVNIVDNNLRPQFKNKDDDSPWSADEKFKNLCETIKDCWDCDAEARLTAGCVLKRVQEIQTQFCTNVIITKIRVLANLRPRIKRRCTL